MTIYNVQGTVIALVEADSPESAIAEMKRRAEAADLAAAEDGGSWNAFVSDDQDQTADFVVPPRPFRQPLR